MREGGCTVSGKYLNNLLCKVPIASGLYQGIRDPEQIVVTGSLVKISVDSVDNVDIVDSIFFYSIYSKRFYIYKGIGAWSGFNSLNAQSIEPDIPRAGSIQRWGRDNVATFTPDINTGNDPCSITDVFPFRLDKMDVIASWGPGNAGNERIRQEVLYLLVRLFAVAVDREDPGECPGDDTDHGRRPFPPPLLNFFRCCPAGLVVGPGDIGFFVWSDRDDRQPPVLIFESVT